jgi:hypothetical protein
MGVSIGFDKLLEYGGWGLLAFVVLSPAWMAFARGLDVNIKIGGKK